MTGEEEQFSQLEGFGKEVRRTLIRHGVSAETYPTAPFYIASGQDPLSEEALTNLTGDWNLQADATLSHLMDFSDYFVHPWSQTVDETFWRQSQKAFNNAVCLERPQVLERVLACPALCEKVFGTNDPIEAKQRHAEMLYELSQDPKYVKSASQVNKDGLIR